MPTKAWSYLKRDDDVLKYEYVCVLVMVRKWCLSTLATRVVRDIQYTSTQPTRTTELFQDVTSFWLEITPLLFFILFFFSLSAFNPVAERVQIFGFTKCLLWCKLLHNKLITKWVVIYQEMVYVSDDFFFFSRLIRWNGHLRNMIPCCYWAESKVRCGRGSFGQHVGKLRQLNHSTYSGGRGGGDMLFSAPSPSS